MNSRKMLMLLAVVVLNATLVSGQNFSDAKNTVIAVTATVDNEIVTGLDDIAPESKKEEQKNRDNTNHLNEIANQATYDLITKKMEDALQMQFTSLDELSELLSFNLYGYPNSLIPKSTVKKLGKKGFTGDYYFSFVLRLERKEIPMKEIMKEAKMAGKEGDFIYPQVSVEIKVFDEVGKKVKVLTAEKQGMERIFSKDFSDGRFDRLERDHIDELWERYIPLVDETIGEAVGAINKA